MRPLKTHDAENVRYIRVCAELLHVNDKGHAEAVLFCGHRALIMFPWCEGEHILKQAKRCMVMLTSLMTSSVHFISVVTQKGCAQWVAHGSLKVRKKF